MTTAITNIATIIGIDAHVIEMEADVSIGLGAFNIVGLPDGAIKESRDRIMAAPNNSCGGFPVRKVLINLAPADIRKMGTGFDLPIAMAILEDTLHPAITDHLDFSDVRGQETAKRALEIAASGKHNCLTL